MDLAAQEFVRLCDVAIAEAMRVAEELRQAGGPGGSLEMAALTVENLQKLRQSAVDETLLRPSLGAGLGLSRGVGDWTEDDGLMAAVRQVERHYREKM